MKTQYLIRHKHHHRAIVIAETPEEAVEIAAKNCANHDCPLAAKDFIAEPVGPTGNA